MLKMRSLSVSEVNQYVKRILASDPLLRQMMVAGEVSNLTKHSSGHMYFTLKDDVSKLSCVMFDRQASLLKFDLENGDKIAARGQITVYERDGRYQLYVQDIEKKGLGELHIAFEKLKKTLYEAGYFDENQKKPLPKLPKTIGVITSPTGAAIRDIISVYKRRSPLSELKVFPVRVQGDFSKDEIVNAIDFFNREANVDLIILARGGGSIEELWSFNERVVAEAIYHSKIPILTGVGHEIDFTIADFVADKRAATPSAAAEIAIVTKDSIMGELEYQLLHMKKAMTRKVSEANVILAQNNPTKIEKTLQHHIKSEYQSLNLIKAQLLNAVRNNMREIKDQLQLEQSRLHVLSPLSTLERGYAVAKKDGRVLSTVEGLVKGEAISIDLKDGQITAVVENINKRSENN